MSMCTDDLKYNEVDRGSNTKNKYKLFQHLKKFLIIDHGYKIYK
jgi:hypothetical protein